MNQSPIRIEHILDFTLSFILLFSLWQTYTAKIRKLRNQLRRYLPRRWKPRSPKDSSSFQSGIELAVLKPKTDSIAYSQRKRVIAGVPNISQPEATLVPIRSVNTSATFNNRYMVLSEMENTVFTFLLRF